MILQEMLESLPPLRGNGALMAWIRERKGLDGNALTDDELEALWEEMDCEMRHREADEQRTRDAWRQLEDEVPVAYRWRREKDFSHVARTFSSLMEGENMVITGINGSGKTALAWGVYIEDSLEGRRGVVITSATRLMSRLKTLVYERGRMLEEVVAQDYGKGTRRLFIDEIDKIQSTDANFALLLEVVDYRWQWGLQTVVMGNGTLEQIRTRMGQSAYARILSGGARAVRLPDADWRRK